ncbi:nicotinate-nucleotide--dimethylbenzimidazole phosphoribosyltransferase [Granulicella arctica]|uniref:Nicotinate-nucleotide--dimethylbenzimidazole phosphoribosyltransferase n=1 Tax=Granulicella arctica TaxID=940613 RepID=A0A7Y9PHL4_9BACT|nr:nicotinate-nucleotide--dimethylbenzimidazole phosphoribosyltransferase [Granulicella arctica]NYF80044.1 nicotinate-nucleotide--dimethylbenzimidazole phosphoribosyltransferase [Granulicella arctica]
MSFQRTRPVAYIPCTIEPPSEVWRQRARAHLDTLTKPLGSLGRLEDIAAQIVSIRRERFTEKVNKGAYVFAADHGITAEGVSAYPREVTHQMVLNFLAQGAAINVLARLHDVELRVVDVGVDADFHNLSSLLHHKVSKGTQNMLHEAAMTDEQLAQALAVGAAIADDASAAGQTMIAIGEMGIGNTTSASAITCALIGATATQATGHGTGMGVEAHARKVSIVQAIVSKHFTASSANSSALEILRCVGGLEIAAMVGMILTAANHQLVIVADGFISTAAAALAVAIAPTVQGYLIAGHQSEEPGHKLLLDHLNLVPVLMLNMRLGEGTGAVLAMPILESAIALYTQMATFTSAGVSGASR